MTKATSNPVQPVRLMWVPLLMLLLGSSVCGFVTNEVYDIRGKYVSETISEFGQLPSAGIQAASLEFRGIVADYLFFKIHTYLGMKLGENKNPMREEWHLMYQMLQRVTDLDPRFWDPYLFAEMMLVWQAGMFEEGNSLLYKACRHRTEDYRPHYYIGFNHMFFKKDAVKAAPYFRKAAQYPHAPEYLKGLAARFSLYANETSTGIFFLENLIRETSNPQVTKYLEKRLSALKMIFFIEQKVKKYQEENGEQPRSLGDLITAGIVTRLPNDPYGGKFILTKNGRVYSTSKLVNVAGTE